MMSDANVAYKKIHGYRFGTLKDDAGISKNLRAPLFFKKWHREPEFMDLIENTVALDDVVFDLGGNIGYATLLFSRLVGAKGSVIAVEPSSRNFELLSHNVDINGISNVTVMQIAIGLHTGEIELNLTDQSNMNSILESASSVAKELVPWWNFSELVSDLKVSPNFIKMDIEGAETLVIKGMSSFLTETERCSIIMEVHPNMYGPHNDVTEMFDILQQTGFRVSRLISASHHSLPDWAASKYQPIKVYRSGNYSRGVYSDVEFEDAIALVKNTEVRSVPLRYTVGNLLKGRFSEKTAKCVRAILFQKNQHD